MYLWAAFIMGFAGSAHCVGMCGPLVLTLRSALGYSEVVHHSGRVLCYALLGAVAGALGHSFNLMNVQQLFSIGLGLLLVTSVLIWPVARLSRRVESALGRVSLVAHRWVTGTGFSRPVVRFMTGMANGLLPCGLVYVGLAGAAVTYTPWDGALFMLVFGAGTLPALLWVVRMGHLISAGVRTNIRKALPVFILLMGLLLILRGSNLDVPYLSPARAVEQGVPDCD